MADRLLTCEECGKEFAFRANGKPAKRCSEECRKAANARRCRSARAAKAWKPSTRKRTPKIQTCRYCGADFDAKTIRAEVCYSKKCQARKQTERCRPYNALRRGQLRGAESELFDPREIFDRDDWICGLCFEDVDPDLVYPDPRSASLDHIQPLARGGSHTRANTQLAHLSCNNVKGARVAA